MGKKSKQNKKNKKPQKNQPQSQPQNQPKNPQQSKSQSHPKPAPSPKSQEYVPLEHKFQVNHTSSRKGRKRNRNNKRQNEYSFDRIQEPIPNKGLTNLGNSCFANALFQCLYHVTAFRDSVIELEDTAGPLLKSLAHFFKEMNEGSPTVQRAYIDLLDYLFTKRPEINVRGDSSILLRALFEELAKENDNNPTSYLHLFSAGELTKSMTCPQPDCSVNKKIRESMKILEARDINFTLDSASNFFQSSEILRKCSCSEEKQMFQCEYTASDLPEILIIRICDILGSEEATKVLPKFTLKQDTSRKECTYEFVTAVMNTQKGEQGLHSVELSFHNNIYYIFDDNKVYSTNFRSIDLHPKVIFYKKRTLNEPLIDEPVGL